MAGSSLLTLIDDIASLLDDIGTMSKVAAKQTTGVLGDDLALNAQQVSGVRAEREIPVVLTVAKGSFINKLILVPAALLISAFVPVLITVLLVIGGIYLCFEGFEKIWHSIFHRQDNHSNHQHRIEAMADPQINMVEYEKQKIKGAIRTDFILSAEIIVISLGAVQSADFVTQVIVVSLLAVAITIGVYGIVAGIVKLDDLGLYLQRSAAQSGNAKFKFALGRGLLSFAPILMKMLSIVGTAAMFMVGGGILVHDIELIHQLQQYLFSTLNDVAFVHTLSTLLFDVAIGILAGGLALLVVSLSTSLFLKNKE